MTGGGRSGASAKQRLRQKLQVRGNQGEAAADAGEQSTCPLQPPADPDVLEMVAEAEQLFHKDQKEAKRLYHLAAQKGYIPAFVLLANRARHVNDEMLAIESLFSLLLSREAPRQIPADLLQNHVGELVMLLNQPKHAAETRRRKQDIDELSRTWPMFKEVDKFTEAQDVLSSIKSLMLKSQIETLISQPAADASSTLLSQAQACTAQAVPSAGPVDQVSKRAPETSNSEQADEVANITALLNSSNERAKLIAQVNSCNQSMVSAMPELPPGLASAAKNVDHAESVARVHQDRSNDHASLLASVKQACNGSTQNAETSERSATEVLSEGANTSHAELVARLRQTCSEQSSSSGACNVTTEAGINLMD
mmetsp:Transcript_62348/g.118343  ORF Transcript_62348/g.118343 Transcript_62348/m.118343 type:complete len:367 (-) Transcript_62348:88-1188(-)